ncbi:MAG: FAD-dependent oxidoreductase, partial [Burkholderiales bacterium]|nr:FAD-dependent oxidoreductase [Burkholderiales bacterium]
MTAIDTLDADVLVVGAGPAGLSLAAALGDLGLRVTLLEQQPLAALQE